MAIISLCSAQAVRSFTVSLKTGPFVDVDKPRLQILYRYLT